MEQNILKKFAALDADVLCQCKTITQPLGFTPYFHNHDGCEILLILGGILSGIFTPSEAGYKGAV